MDFAYCFSVSIVDFEQVNTGWVYTEDEYSPRE